MAVQIVNQFSSYELSNEEILAGSIFTTLQKQVLQNLLSSYAEEKLTIEYDIDQPLKHIQIAARGGGQMEVLIYLLENSNSAEEALVNLQKEYAPES